MHWDEVQGRWTEMTGKVRERWGQLTDDDVDEAAGDREQFEDKIQQRYGRTKEEARQEVDEWMTRH
jgi:uncharacterized protein YjbJ (UPF0337 family)